MVAMEAFDAHPMTFHARRVLLALHSRQTLALTGVQPPGVDPFSGGSFRDGNALAVGP